MRRNGPNLFTHLPQAGNRTLPQYAPEGTAEDANNCTIRQEALYSHRRPVAVTTFDRGDVFRKLESADIDQ